MQLFFVCNWFPMNESAGIKFCTPALFLPTAYISSPSVRWSKAALRQSAFAAGASKSVCESQSPCIRWQVEDAVWIVRSRNSVKESFSQRAQTGFARLTINRTAAQPEYTHVTFPNTDLYCSHAHIILLRGSTGLSYIVRNWFGRDAPSGPGVHFLFLSLLFKRVLKKKHKKSQLIKNNFMYWKINFTRLVSW